MRYRSVECACLVAFLGLLPIAALVHERCLDAGSSGGAWLVTVVMAVAAMDAFALAHDLASH